MILQLLRSTLWFRRPYPQMRPSCDFTFYPLMIIADLPISRLFIHRLLYPLLPTKGDPYSEWSGDTSALTQLGFFLQFHFGDSADLIDPRATRCHLLRQRLERLCLGPQQIPDRTKTEQRLICRNLRFESSYSVQRWYSEKHNLIFSESRSSGRCWNRLG